MSKRKLSLQQRRRIDEQRAAKKNKIKENIDISKLGDIELGLVIAHFGREALIEGKSALQKCHLRANLDLCTGDKVQWRPNIESGLHEGLGVVESREPRQTEIQRPDSYGKMRTIAANVSQLLITIAPKPEPHTSLIDRYLVAASLHGLQPIILFNKRDLLSECKDETVKRIDTLYSSLNYQTIYVSTKQASGIKELPEHLINNTSIFVGQSGVGKSSLIKALLPDQDIRIGELSEAEDKGKHTTTHSQLYRFKTGGYCIDSPGIREFGLWHATPEDILSGFPEIADVANQCRFRDCAHGSEPGCAVKAAIKQGAIDPRRYENYKTILSQLSDVTIKTK